MAAPILTPSVIPTGGAIALGISGAVSGVATLTRTASGVGVASGIYAGPACGFYLDLGDGLPQPLDPTLFYQYAYTDVTGTAITDWIKPSVSFVVQTEGFLQMFIRLIQATLNSVTLPAGIAKPQVTNAMPLGGTIPLPLIVVSEDLTQQATVPIGQSVPIQPSQAAVGIGGSASGYTVTGFANRTFRVSVLVKDATSRDFFRDMILGMFESIYGSVLQPLGVDVTHKWQATVGQVANDKVGMGPGFYYAEVMLEFEGTMNVSIYPSYGVIETIQTTVSGAAAGEGSQTIQAIDVITVPLGG